MHLGQFLLKWIPMEIIIQWLISLKISMTQKGIMRSMIENYLESLKHLKNGSTISKDLDIQQLFTLITRTWPISSQPKKLNQRQARWALYLSEFDLKLIHIPGAKMIQSDTLSQWPDYIPDEDNNNVDRILLPENMFINLMDLDLQDRIANMDKYDYDVKNTLELLLENRPHSLWQDLEDWQLEKHRDKNILFYKDKNYIPDDLDLRQDIVKMFHDHEMAGHPGELETYNSVKQHYWWPGMCTYVKRYVQGCGNTFGLQTYRISINWRKNE